MYQTQRNGINYKETIEQLGGPAFIEKLAHHNESALLMTMLAFPGIIKQLLPTSPEVFYAPNHEHRIKTLIDNLHVNKRSSLRFHC